MIASCFPKANAIQLLLVNKIIVSILLTKRTSSLITTEQATFVSLVVNMLERISTFSFCIVWSKWLYVPTFTRTMKTCEKACSFPNRVCDWLSKQQTNQLNNAPSAWNNKIYRIREWIKIHWSGRGTGLLKLLSASTVVITPALHPQKSSQHVRIHALVLHAMAQFALK